MDLGCAISALVFNFWRTEDGLIFVYPTLSPIEMGILENILCIALFSRPFIRVFGRWLDVGYFFFLFLVIMSWLSIRF